MAQLIKEAEESSPEAFQRGQIAMTYTDLSPLATHLCPSTIFAAAMWALTLPLNQNRAAVRYRLWLAASVKFLFPFSLLVSIGRQFGWRATPATPRPRLPLPVLRA